MENEIYKLDSIEDGIAAVEDPFGGMIYIKAERLPENSHAGDCFVLENGEFVFLLEETESRKARISSLLDKLVKKNGQN